MTRVADYSGKSRRWAQTLGSAWAVFGKVALSGAVISLIIAGIILAREAESTRVDPSPRAEPRYVVHESGAGYSFRYPSAWNLEQQGQATKVEHPSGSAVVSFDVGGPQRLMVQGGAYMTTLRATYKDVFTTESRRYRAGRDPALWIAGEAVNQGDMRLTFLANIVSEPGRAVYIASAFVPAGEEELLRDAEAIASSLHAR